MCLSLGSLSSLVVFSSLYVFILLAFVSVYLLFLLLCKLYESGYVAALSPHNTKVIILSLQLSTLFNIDSVYVSVQTVLIQINILSKM